MKRAAPETGPPFFFPPGGVLPEFAVICGSGGGADGYLAGRFGMSRGVQGFVSAMALLVLAGPAFSQDCPSCLGSGVTQPPPHPTGSKETYGAYNPGSSGEPGSQGSSGSTGSSGVTGSSGSPGISLRPATGLAPVIAWEPVTPMPATSGGVAIPRACYTMSADGRITAIERPQWTQLNCAQYYP